MNNTSIKIDLEQITRLFPIHIIVDSSLSILSLGRKLTEAERIDNNKSFNSLFAIKQPEIANLTFSNLIEFKDETVIIELISNPLILFQGHFEIIDNNTKALFIGDPFNKIEITSTNNCTSNNEQLDLEKLSLVARANENGVLYIDINGSILWANESFSKLTGYSFNEGIGQLPIKLFRGPLTNKRVLAKISKSFKTGESIDEEVIIYRKDGTSFWAKIKAQSNQTQVNDKRQYFAIIEDVTAEKNAKEKLLKSENRLTALITNLQTGILLEDENNNLVITNQKFCTMFGIHHSPQSFVGSNSENTAIHKHQIFINAEQFEKRINQILKDKKPVIDELSELIDGRIFSRDYIPIFIEKEYKGHLWAYTDVTIKKNTEISLRMREEKYRNIIANMNLGLVEVDLHENILFANQCFCEMSGYDYDELVNHSTLDLFIKGDYINLLKEQNENRKKGTSDTYEIAVKDKRGSLKWWLISGAPKINDKGEIVGTIGIFLDITQQKALEADLIEARKSAEESSKAKESFLANMSHEIRTPLNAIIGMVRELSRNNDDSMQNTYLHNAETAANHLLSIINNILDISKIEAGEFQLENRHFSLRNIINDTITIVSVNAKEKALDLEINIDDSLATAFIGDDSRIRQILINLIGNSIKFTEKGKITLHCTGENQPGLKQLIKLSILDTGIGINEKYLENLFTKFSQEDKSIARKFGGTGLGMAITYELIQLMGGEMKVESKKNEGTLVNIYLPLKIGDVRKTELTPLNLDIENLKDLKILLVEDNEWNRMVACNSLFLHNIKPIEAENGVEAIEELKKGMFDIILMDLQMPIMDGIEATKIIRNELKINTPIIALTANALKKEIDYCLTIGFNDYIIKPFDESTFFNTILKNINAPKSEIILENKSEETIISDDKLYSLEKLIEASRGNDWFVEKMVNVFIEQTNSAVVAIRNAYNVKDHKTIKEIAHRIKPSIDNMCINSIKTDIRELERVAIEEPNSPALNYLIEKIEDILKRVVKILSLRNN